MPQTKLTTLLPLLKITTISKKGVYCLIEEKQLSSNNYRILIQYFCEIFENSEKYSSQFLRAKDDAFRLIVLSTPQSKLQRYSIYNDIKQEQQIQTIFV